MSTIVKKDLIKAMEEELKVPKAIAEETIDFIFGTIINTLKDGDTSDKFKIAGFGTFRLKERKARKARNPKTGEEVMAPASKTIAFRPEKSVKESL